MAERRRLARQGGTVQAGGLDETPLFVDETPHKSPHKSPHKAQASALVSSGTDIASAAQQAADEYAALAGPVGLGGQGQEGKEGGLVGVGTDVAAAADAAAASYGVAGGQFPPESKDSSSDEEAEEKPRAYIEDDGNQYDALPPEMEQAQQSNTIAFGAANVLAGLPAKKTAGTMPLPSVAAALPNKPKKKSTLKSRSSSKQFGVYLF